MIALSLDSTLTFNHVTILYYDGTKVFVSQPHMWDTTVYRRTNDHDMYQSSPGLQSRSSITFEEALPYQNVALFEISGEVRYRSIFPKLAYLELARKQNGSRIRIHPLLYFQGPNQIQHVVRLLFYNPSRKKPHNFQCFNKLNPKIDFLLKNSIIQ